MRTQEKAPGAANWRFQELPALPIPILEGSATFYDIVEKEDKWPKPLSISLIALVPKNGAKSESELRPSGHAPIDRVWACVNKCHNNLLTQSMYGFKFLSASYHAWNKNTRVEHELARDKIAHGWYAFLWTAQNVMSVFPLLQPPLTLLPREASCYCQHGFLPLTGVIGAS